MSEETGLGLNSETLADLNRALVRPQCVRFERPADRIRIIPRLQFRYHIVFYLKAQLMPDFFLSQAQQHFL